MADRRAWGHHRSSAARWGCMPSAALGVARRSRRLAVGPRGRRRKSSLLCTRGLWPRSTLLGPNLTPAPGDAMRGWVRSGCASTTDPTRRSPRRCSTCWISAGAKASFFCIGERASRHPGHCPGHRGGRPHGREPHLASLPRVLDLRVPARSGGRSDRRSASSRIFPAGRPGSSSLPAGLRNPLLEPVLCRKGYG